MLRPHWRTDCSDAPGDGTYWRWVRCRCGWASEPSQAAIHAPDLHDIWNAHVAQAVLAAIRNLPPKQMAELRPKQAEPATVDGRTHRCPAPGYAGRHTAVGAGAVSSPYRCHGCGAWFTLDEVRDDV